MQKCQFSEHEYGVAISIELYQGVRNGFFPTQPVEHHIGFDAAYDVQGFHKVWNILRVQIPRRIHISPSLWPRLPKSNHADIPSRFCSLFMQYKRPNYQDSPRAKHWKAKGDYYEIGINGKQRRVLQEFESKVSGQAVVRYASPAFWSNSDFETHDEKKEILDFSAYLSPAEMKSHKKWMFTSDSTGFTTFFNPDFEEGKFESWKVLVGRIFNTLGKETTLRFHVARLAASIRGQELFKTDLESLTINRISQYMEISPENLQLLYDTQTVARAAHAQGLEWTVVAEDGGQYGLLPNKWRDGDPGDWLRYGF